jgi:two-component system sensor histidine kinase VanS
MKSNKNYLLSTLFKGYVIQCAACSVLILGGTFLLGIMAEEILRKYVLHYYLYYRRNRGFRDFAFFLCEKVV